MRKKILLLASLTALLALLSGCCLFHDWQEATCEAPISCANCEKTKGEALGHTWADPTCANAKTCTVCGKTDGEPLGHTWQKVSCATPFVCTVCKWSSLNVPGHDIRGMNFIGSSFYSKCPDCGVFPEEPIDWEFYSGVLIQAQWKATQYTADYKSTPPEGDGITFFSDGTLESVYKGEISSGTWSFDCFDERVISYVRYNVTIGDTQYQAAFMDLLPDNLYLWTDDESLTIDFARILS